MVRKIFTEYYFRFSQMGSCIWNPDLDTLTWFTPDIEDDIRKVPNDKPLVLSQSNKIVVTPMKRMQIFARLHHHPPNQTYTIFR